MIDGNGASNAKKNVADHRFLAVTEQLNERRRAELFRVFSGNLHHNLKILSHIICEHLFQTFEGLLNRKATKEIYNPLDKRE
jgi:hypothetical protein